jgi:hypothetical protein
MTVPRQFAAATVCWGDRWQMGSAGSLRLEDWRAAAKWQWRRQARFPAAVRCSRLCSEKSQFLGACPPKEFEVSQLRIAPVQVQDVLHGLIKSPVVRNAKRCINFVAARIHPTWPRSANNQAASLLQSGLAGGLLRRGRSVVPRNRPEIILFDPPAAGSCPARPFD